MLKTDFASLNLCHFINSDSRDRGRVAGVIVGGEPKGSLAEKLNRTNKSTEEIVRNFNEAYASKTEKRWPDPKIILENDMIGKSEDIAMFPSGSIILVRFMRVAFLAILINFERLGEDKYIAFEPLEVKNLPRSFKKCRVDSDMVSLTLVAEPNTSSFKQVKEGIEVCNRLLRIMSEKAE